jgi:hypothetical protein
VKGLIVEDLLIPRNGIVKTLIINLFQSYFPAIFSRSFNYIIPYNPFIHRNVFQYFQRTFTLRLSLHLSLKIYLNTFNPRISQPIHKTALQSHPQNPINPRLPIPPRPDPHNNTLRPTPILRPNLFGHTNPRINFYLSNSDLFDPFVTLGDSVVEVLYAPVLAGLEECRGGGVGISCAAGVRKEGRVSDPEICAAGVEEDGKWFWGRADLELNEEVSGREEF